jgi:hypothetical protein
VRTIADEEALREFRRLYGEQWLIERHGFPTPSQARTDLGAASRALDADPTCCRVGRAAARETLPGRPAILQTEIPIARRIAEVIIMRGLAGVIGGEADEARALHSLLHRRILS